jgi:signal transduction histidine kinase
MSVQCYADWSSKRIATLTDEARVFDLFVQTDPSSHRANDGLGVGLAIVRSLVERHGGEVRAASAGRGHGSEFTVRLPIAAE